MFHLSLRPLRPLSNGKQSPTYWIQYLHVRTMRQSWALTSRLTWLVRTGPDVSIPNLYANELGIDRWLGPWRACTWFWRIDFFCSPFLRSDWTFGAGSKCCTDRIAKRRSRRWRCSPSARRSGRRRCSSCRTRRACSRANTGSTSPSSPWIKGDSTLTAHLHALSP